MYWTDQADDLVCFYFYLDLTLSVVQKKKIIGKATKPLFYSSIDFGNLNMKL